MPEPPDDGPLEPQVQHSDPVAQAGFMMIPNAVAFRPNLSAEAKLVYGYLSYLSWRGRGRDVTSARDVMARDLGVSAKKVTWAIQELGREPTVADDGESPPLVVSIRRGLGKPNLYVVNDPRTPPAPTDRARREPQRRAWETLTDAVERGAVVRGGCEVDGCDADDTEAVQEDYSKPLDVVWLCRRHNTDFGASRKSLSDFLGSPKRPDLARAHHEENPRVRTGEGPPVAPPAVREKNRPATVDRKRVSDSEYELASSVLDAFNTAAGTAYSAQQWVAKIVARIRENPDMTLADHEQVIRHSLAHPWWTGPASPSVVYGNAGQFERSRHAAAAGESPFGDVGLSADEIRTYMTVWGPGTPFETLAAARAAGDVIEIPAGDVVEDETP